MRVCLHKGYVIAVLTRNEHCPPHVHVKGDRWDARFLFGFCDNGVRLWDVIPSAQGPTVATLEELRLVLKQPANLQKARELWWQTRQTLCLDNLLWDAKAGAVVGPRERRPGACPILAARFDPVAYLTVLSLAGQDDPLEIEL